MEVLFGFGLCLLVIAIIFMCGCTAFMTAILAAILKAVAEILKAITGGIFKK